MRKSTERYHDPEVLNRAIVTLREECQDHLSCKECPFVATNSRCLLTEYSPCDWDEVDEDE